MPKPAASSGSSGSHGSGSHGRSSSSHGRLSAAALEDIKAQLVAAKLNEPNAAEDPDE